MTNKEKQWLLSLSLVSLLGPACDVAYLTGKGFYKKPSKGGLDISDSLALETDKDLIESYLEEMNVVTEEAYRTLLDELLQGSVFAGNAQKLLQLGRTMDDVTREIPKSFIINGHPYLYDFFEVLMQYEFHWPKNGFRCFELANYAMLVRLGMPKGWLNEEEVDRRLEDLKPHAEEVFDDYKSFGAEAVTGRHIYCRYLKQIGSAGGASGQKDILSIAYHCLWQYME